LNKFDNTIRLVLRTYYRIVIVSKNEHFFNRGIHLLSKKWEKVIASDEKYFK